MMKFHAAIGLCLFAVSTVLAGDVAADKQVKELEKMLEEGGIYVETAKKGVVLSGYVDASYSYNLNGGGTDAGFNGTPGSIRTHQFDVDSNDFNVNQVKIALEKALPDENTWAAGFRVDLMFGEDVKYLADNDWGLGEEELAVEQAYVQFRVPVGNGLDFKFGKFVTLLGYEVIETPANINVSRGYLFTYAIPLYHTGFLMTYKFNDIVEAKLGLVNGWNNSDSNFLDGDGDGGPDLDNGTDGPADFAKAITGQIALHAPGGNADLVTSFIYSFEGEATPGLSSTLNGSRMYQNLELDPAVPSIEQTVEQESGYENDGVFVLDIWGQWRPKFANDRLLLAFNADLGKSLDNLHRTHFEIRQSEDGVDFDTYDYAQNTATWWGAALYAKYQFTDIFSLATRLEYFHDNDGTARLADGLVRSGIIKYGSDFLDLANIDISGWEDESVDYYFGSDTYVTHTDVWSATFTAGFDLWENMLARLEYRLDVISSDGGDPNEITVRNTETGEEQSGSFPEDNAFTNNKSTQHTLILDFTYSF